MKTQNYNINFSDLTLVIPAKEEPDCLQQVLEELEEFNLNKIVVIPLGIELPTNWNFSKLKIVNQQKNGYGNAILTGIEKVNTKYFCIFNADGSFDPNELKNLIETVKKFDFVFSSRYLKNASSDDDTILTYLGNYIFSMLGKIFFQTKISDILYTYLIGDKIKFQELNIKSQDFSFCVEVPIKIEKKNFLYTDVISHERKRISGEKNVNEFIDGFKILSKMINLFFNRKI